jgi:hypothetical protein
VADAVRVLALAVERLVGVRAWRLRLGARRWLTGGSHSHRLIVSVGPAASSGPQGAPSEWSYHSATTEELNRPVSVQVEVADDGWWKGWMSER